MSRNIDLSGGFIWRRRPSTWIGFLASFWCLCESIRVTASLHPNKPFAGTFVLQSRIPSTGIGEVWLATSTTNDRSHTLEIFPGRSDLEPRFHSFVRGLVTASGTPLTPSVLDGGRADELFYLVMEPFPSYVSLAARLEGWRSSGSLPDMATVAALCDLLCARLERVHRPASGRSPQVHGNLSPASVLVSAEADGAPRDVLFLDLGLAPFLSLKGLDKQTTRRLDRYQPPENEGDPTPLLDVFSLGVVLLELLTGTTDLPGKPPDEVLSIAYSRYEKDLVPAIKAARGDRSAVLGEALLRAFRLKHYRYQSVEEMRRAIGDAMTKMNKVQGGPGWLSANPPEPIRVNPPEPMPPNSEQLIGLVHIQGEHPRPGGKSVSPPRPVVVTVNEPPQLPPKGPPGQNETKSVLHADTLPGLPPRPPLDDPDLTDIDGVWRKVHRERFAGVPTGCLVVENVLTHARAVLKPVSTKRLQLPEGRERLRDEVKVPNRFLGPARHHVRRVLDLVEQPKTVQTPYLVLEPVDGVPLDALVRQNQRLSVENTLLVLRQLALVLTEAKSHDLAHGELDPSNLLIEADRDGLFVKVLNFGATREETNTTHAIPVPMTHAPEQLRQGGRKSPATDVWAFGQLAFYMLVGSFYFVPPLLHRDVDAVMGKRLREVLPTARARECGWELPRAEEFDRWFASCAVLDPAERPTAEEAFREFERIYRPSRIPKPIPISLPPGADRGPRPSLTPCEQIKAHGDTVRTLAVSPSGMYFATGGIDRRICIWDTSRRALVEVLSEHEETVRSVAWCGDAWVVSCGGDRTLRFWELGLGRQPPRCFVLESQTSFLNTVVGMLDENRQPLIFTGGMDFAVRCRYRSQSGEWGSSVVSTGAMPVRGLAVAADGRRLLAASDLQEPILYDLDAAHECVGSKSMHRHTDGVCAVAISPDGQRAVSGSRDRTVKVWLLHDREFITAMTTLKGHDADVSCVAFLSDNLVASGSYDGTVRVWDVKAEQCVEVFDGHQGAIWCLGVADQGNTLLSGGSDGLVRVWKRGTGAPGTRSLFG